MEIVFVNYDIDTHLPPRPIYLDTVPTSAINICHFGAAECASLSQFYIRIDSVVLEVTY
jgi:hypothetical protein